MSNKRRPEDIYRDTVLKTHYILQRLIRDYKKNLIELSQKKKIEVKSDNGFFSTLINKIFGREDDIHFVTEKLSSGKLKRIQNTKKYLNTLQGLLTRIDKLSPPEEKYANGNLRSRIENTFNRIKFIGDTYGHHTMPLHKTMNGTINVSKSLISICNAWEHSDKSAPEPMDANAHPLAPVRPKIKGKKNHIADQRQGDLILQGGHSNDVYTGPRIWLPVPASRRHEMLQKGAMEDRSSGLHRGSHLWIPLDMRHQFENNLPLSFRDIPPKLEYPPIQKHAVGQNLWQIFDKDTWNHIRFNSYDRWGHRCQLCGKQFGNLWKKIATQKELEHPGPVDCHEVWEWSRLEGYPDIGIQRLKEVMVICKDCHATFHEGRTLKLAREHGIEEKARLFIEKKRCLNGHLKPEQLHAAMEKTREQWHNMKDIKTWMIDLSVLANQNFMQGHTMTMKTNNAAKVDPAMIIGTNFKTDDGQFFEKKNIQDIIKISDTNNYLI